MSILAKVTSLFFCDVRTSITSLLVGYVVFMLAKFYAKVFSLPSGPMPLPFIGNILYFKGSKQHWACDLEKLAAKYGPVFTFWLGNKPIVIIDDIDITKEVSRLPDFSGRPQDFLFPNANKLLANDLRSNVLFADYSHRWEALRRVTHSAVIKYAATEKLENLVSDTVDYTMEQIIAKEGLNKKFCPHDYIFNLFCNIMASSTIGQRYDIDDPEFKMIKYTMKGYGALVTRKLFYWKMTRLMRWYDRKLIYEMSKLFIQLSDMLFKRFKSHYEDYDESVIRNFCDALISAKNESIKSDRESAPYLCDGNLSHCIFDLLTAGTDTSQQTFKWCLIHMLYNRELEEKLREEVESVIGDRMPTHEDRNRCHYVMAFINEVLRNNNIEPTGIHRKTVVTTKIGDITIPKDTEVITFHGHIHHKSEDWDRPYEFIPERFLDSDGKHIIQRPKAFIPFGVGRRVCLGEKLAYADLFLVLVRFLQKTTDYEILLHCDPTQDMTLPDPNNVNELQPKPFEITFKPK